MNSKRPLSRRRGRRRNGRREGEDRELGSFVATLRMIYGKWRSDALPSPSSSLLLLRSSNLARFDPAPPMRVGTPTRRRRQRRRRRRRSRRIPCQRRGDGDGGGVCGMAHYTRRPLSLSLFLSPKSDFRRGVAWRDCRITATGACDPAYPAGFVHFESRDGEGGMGNAQHFFHSASSSLL